MADLEISLGSKSHGHIVNALGLGEEFLQGGLRLLFHARNVARNFQGDLFRHEDDQVGALFGHREQGKPGIDVAGRDGLTRDVANHIQHGACVDAQHRQTQSHQVGNLLRTQAHERDWSYCSRRPRANS